MFSPWGHYLQCEDCLCSERHINCDIRFQTANCSSNSVSRQSILCASFPVEHGSMQREILKVSNEQANRIGPIYRGEKIWHICLALTDTLWRTVLQYYFPFVLVMTSLVVTQCGAGIIALSEGVFCSCNTGEWRFYLTVRNCGRYRRTYFKAEHAVRKSGCYRQDTGA